MSLSNGFTKPERLAPEPHERIWGSTELEPWFPNPAGKIGEVWFREPDSPVLVKFLFATENLSVQVHPGDVLAQQRGHRRGKTEMWHILRAEPKAQIALGFESAVTADQVRRAAANGSIMGLLRWIPVSAGDTWFIPAGAVHAIGAGITLCEVQQNSDVTYRLFDYGRGRDLHIEESLRALDFGFQASAVDYQSTILVNCPFFQVRSFDTTKQAESSPVDLAIVVDGSGTLNSMPFVQGEVWNTTNGGPLRITGNARLLTVSTRTLADSTPAQTQAPG